jgi:UMF1 family MFS transporter
MSRAGVGGGRAAWLERLGLHRPELRAWVLYDWANSAFMTTVIAAVFPIYFQTVAAADLDPATALARYGYASTVAVAAVAVLSPVLGALADYAALKKKLLAVFLALGVASTAAMVTIERGDWLLAATLFVLGNIGAFGSMAFYDSLLPHIASEDEIDRVSSAGYALGYLGGGLLLAVNLLWILRPDLIGLRDADQASRAAFVSVAVWWLLFSVPLFRRVPEPPARREADERLGRLALLAAFDRLGETVRELRLYREAFLMLVAFAVYNDGINTIIRMATSYGVQIGLARTDLVAAILLVQFAGVPFAFAFGMLADALGTKRAIFASLGVYTLISVLGFYMTTARDFYLLAFLVATVQGGSQALSRSLFATLVPRYKSSEFFGFYGIFEKFTGILGPYLFAETVARTGSARLAILSVIAFFVVGAGLLAFVDVERGQRAARAADARAI